MRWKLSVSDIIYDSMRSVRKFRSGFAEVVYQQLQQFLALSQVLSFSSNERNMRTAVIKKYYRVIPYDLDLVQL